ncbi:hypothetical protein K1719_044040 [Acacia pycnantha]|nr:hypothetical protein K1719_044040 [Acacia pycnantha]
MYDREGIVASGAADDCIRLFVENNESLVDGGPLYKLLLKKENAHNMDINSVQWSPGRRLEEYEAILCNSPWMLLLLNCYANVVLQCLAFTPPLTAYLLQGLHSKACANKKGCFTCEFESLVLKSKGTKNKL